jgi:3-oxoacyl-[acyl-carrier protein] reductase
LGHDILKDKVAIVTGSSRGIGKSIALKFADESAKLVINYSQEKAPAEETFKEVLGSRTEAILVKAVVSNQRDIDRLVEATMDKFGRIDILVNNAGIALVKPLLETSEEDWDHVVDTNLKSVFLCSKRVIPIMLKQGGGRIINLASIDSFVAEPNCSAYCASKGGVLILTFEMAVELGSKNITVNAIAPGFINTPQNDYVLKTPALMNQLIARTPVKRIGEPSDVAEAALFFAKDGTEFITGTVLYVDGGWMAAGGNEGIQAP